MNIYQYLNEIPERLVEKSKLFSRRTNQYKILISNRNKVSHLLSVTKNSGDQIKFDYLSSLIYGCPPRELSQLLCDIINGKSLSRWDERSFIKI